MVIRSLFKKLIVVLSVLFMLTSVFVKHNTIEADTTSFSKDVQGKFINWNYGFKVSLFNYDEETFGSITASIVVKETGEQAATTITRTSLSDATQPYSDIDPSTYTFSFFGTNFQPDTFYTVTITIDSKAYKNEYVDYSEPAILRNSCLERLEITKTWDDNNSKDLRPKEDEYGKLIRLDGKEPNKILKVESTNDNEYKYVAYGGFDIREEIIISEEPLDDYKCTETVNNLRLLSEDDSWQIGYFNVSRASLKNTILKPIKIVLKKIDSEDASALGGVEFEVINKSQKEISYSGNTYADGDVIETIVTGDDGVASIEGLQTSGTYLIKETKTKEGYAEPTFEKIVTLDDATEKEEFYLIDLGSIENEKEKTKTGEIRITKVDANDEKVLLEGATFQVIYNDDTDAVDKEGKAVTKGDVVATIKTDKNGVASTGAILPLKADGDTKYLVKETVVPSGYIDEKFSKEVTIGEANEGVVEITVTNKKETPTPYNPPRREVPDTKAR